MMNFINDIYYKQNRLKGLKSKSNKALKVVTATINQLTSVNEKIDLAISEIGESKEKLQSTENDLLETKSQNNKIIEKCKSVIG